MSLQYLIDANIFITASRTYYDFDFGNSFWDFLVEQGKKEIIASIDKVLNELKKGDDKLKEWATKGFSNYFINTITDNVLKQYVILMQWADSQRNQYSKNAIEEFMKENNADAWLISLALTDIDKYVISVSTKLNRHSCFCKNWFSRHQRAEGETDVTSEPKAKQSFYSFTNRLLRFATANLVMTLFFCLSITCYTLPKCKYTFNFVELLSNI